MTEQDKTKVDYFWGRYAKEVAFYEVDDRMRALGLNSNEVPIQNIIRAQAYVEKSFLLTVPLDQYNFNSVSFFHQKDNKDEEFISDVNYVRHLQTERNRKINQHMEGGLSHDKLFLRPRSDVPLQLPPSSLYYASKSMKDPLNLQKDCKNVVKAFSSDQEIDKLLYEESPSTAYQSASNTPQYCYYTPQQSPNNDLHTCITHHKFHLRTTTYLPFHLQLLCRQILQ
jgi:hypothetical protein